MGLDFSTLIQLLAVFALVLTVQIPALFLGPDYIDDTAVVFTCKQIESAANHVSWKAALAEGFYPAIDREMGRFRPAWWAINYGLYSAFHVSFFERRVFKLCVFFAMAMILFILTRRLTCAPYAPLITNYLFWLCWPYSATLYKFPTQEEFTALAAALIFLTLISAASAAENRARRTLLLLCAAATYGMALCLKETALALGPPMIVWAVWQRFFAKDRCYGDIGAFAAGVVVITAAFVGWFIAHPISKGSFSSGYASIGLDVLCKNATYIWLTPWYSWGFLYPVAFSLAAVRVFRALYRRRFDEALLWRSLLLLYAAGSAMLLAPWMYADDARLFFPALVAIAILAGWELSDAFQALARVFRAPFNTPNAHTVAYWILGTMLACIATRWTLLGPWGRFAGWLLFCAALGLLAALLLKTRNAASPAQNRRVTRVAQFILVGNFAITALIAPAYFWEQSFLDVSQYALCRARMEMMRQIAGQTPFHASLAVVGDSGAGDEMTFRKGLYAHLSLFWDREDILEASVDGRHPFVAHEGEAMLCLGDPQAAQKAAALPGYLGYRPVASGRSAYWRLNQRFYRPWSIWIYPDLAVKALMEPWVGSPNALSLFYPQAWIWTLYLPR